MINHQGKVVIELRHLSLCRLAEGGVLGRARSFVH